MTMGTPLPPPLLESLSYIVKMLQNIDSIGFIRKIFRNKDLDGNSDDHRFPFWDFPRFIAFASYLSKSAHSSLVRCCGRFEEPSWRDGHTSDCHRSGFIITPGGRGVCDDGHRWM
jgi:hypothetical protein